MDLLKIARVPAVTIGSRARVRDAVQAMTLQNAGAVVVVEDELPLGIFTASDLLKRVAAKGLPLDATPITDVMTAPLTVACHDMACKDALSLMASSHIRHLAIVDSHGRVGGMLTTRHLLRNMVESLTQEVLSLDSYYCADGIGG
ncbi:MAG TPA: CBS domain-containing protein [Vicinamibacteria bacterium]|nr:CBS domain-containing protein [Vicinamibacteria bacterium]